MAEFIRKHLKAERPVSFRRNDGNVVCSWKPWASRRAQDIVDKNVGEGRSCTPLSIAR